MTTTLKQFQGSVVAPEDDGKVYKFLGGVAGVVSGCTVTIYANNQLKVASGWGFACGRVFTVEEEVVVANTTAAKGRILVNIDLENVAEPAALTTQSAAVLPALVQEDINADGTVYQLALAQYDIASNTISNLTDVKVVLDDLDARLAAKQNKVTSVANRLFYGSGAEGTLNQLSNPSVSGSFLRQNTDGAPYFSSPKDTNKILGQNGLGSFYSAWGNYGRIIDTNYTFSYYANTVITLISPTSVMIKMSGKMATNYNSSSYVRYGISIPMLSSQISSILSSLGYTLNTVTYLPKSQWLAYKFTDGTLLYNAMEYGACYEVDTTDGILRPARVYNTSGSVGGWGIGTWYTGGFYFDTTIFATVTLA